MFVMIMERYTYVECVEQEHRARNTSSFSESGYPEYSGLAILNFQASTIYTFNATSNALHTRVTLQSSLSSFVFWMVSFLDSRDPSDEIGSSLTH